MPVTCSSVQSRLAQDGCPSPSLGPLWPQGAYIHKNTSNLKLISIINDVSRAYMLVPSPPIRKQHNFVYISCIYLKNYTTTWYSWTYLQNRKRLTDLEEWTYGCWGEGIVREFGMNMYALLHLKWITNKDLLQQGTLLNVMWQPGWEGSLGENAYMYMCGWVPLWSTWNYDNIVNWLYANTK